jgi:hypothetical protein
MLGKVDLATSRSKGKRRSQQRGDGDQSFEVEHKGRHSSVAFAVHCEAVATECRENLRGESSGFYTLRLLELKLGNSKN